MNNTQKIAAFILGGVITYLVYMQLNKKPKIVVTKNPKKTSGGMFSIDQNQADKVAEGIKSIYDEAERERGGKTKQDDIEIKKLLKILHDNGYDYINEKAVKKPK